MNETRGRSRRSMGEAQGAASRGARDAVLVRLPMLCFRAPPSSSLGPEAARLLRSSSCVLDLAGASCASASLRYGGHEGCGSGLGPKHSGWRASISAAPMAWAPSPLSPGSSWQTSCPSC